ncbi:MAG: helix-turn-helix transcriptional regulator, partial [Acidobacteria bacterium]|nr:helix-turn-helix transcriptional regulator [Acidobacteriota bacterium]
KRPPKWLNVIVEKLNDEFIETPTNESLSMLADVHPVHMAAIFRKFHKQTIGEYVQNKRIKYASRLLLNKEIPLSEVALSSGFSDQSHFNRVFKRFTRLTPGEFRKTISGRK